VGCVRYPAATTHYCWVANAGAATTTASSRSLVVGSCNTIVCNFSRSFYQSSLKGGYVQLISSAVKLYDSVSVDSSILAKNLTKLNKDLVPKFEAGCDDSKRIVPATCLGSVRWRSNPRQQMQPQVKEY
jgi:hypothetical protein